VVFLDAFERFSVSRADIPVNYPAGSKCFHGDAKPMSHTDGG
jgi:hypothetical protein